MVDRWRWLAVNNLLERRLDENTVRHGDTEWGGSVHDRLAVMKDFYRPFRSIATTSRR